jgi:hypothetical protein
MVRPCDCRPSSDLVELAMNGENRLCIKRRGAADVANAMPAVHLGGTKSWLLVRFYNEFKNVKSACLSVGLSSRKRFLTCSASPP